MNDDTLLLDLLDEWQEALQQGRSPTAADLCGSRTDLIPHLEEQMAVLKRFRPVDAKSMSSLETPLLPPSTNHPPTTTIGGRPAAGSRFAHFQLLNVLGEGGFGTVYRAEDVLLKRKVAIKILNPAAVARAGAQESFLAEAQALASVQHDHVVPIYHVGCEHGQYFLAMPLLGGETLASRLEREGALPNAEVRRIGREAASGLAAIHAQGLVHRDIKPGNLWLEAGTGRVKVLDLGLAHQPRTMGDQLTGTPPYMSPEQSRGEALDFRSDLFSLGSVLYECATGQRAFAGSTMMETMRNVRDTQPDSAQQANPGVPLELSHTIERLLAKQPTQRPSSAREVAELLREVSHPNATPTHSRLGMRLLVTGLVLIAVSAWIAALYPRPMTQVVVTREPPPKDAPTKVSESLRVKLFEVLHFATLNAQQVEPRGSFGRLSYQATLGDEFVVRVELSRPAYAYLVVFRPDGMDDVLYPHHDTEGPEQQTTIIYPSMQRRGDRYVMEEGTGLWVVAAILSEEPLPSYRTWREQHRVRGWVKNAGQLGTVWYDDGQFLESFAHGVAPQRGPRASKAASDRQPLVQLVDELREQSRGVVSAVGFTVEERRKD